MCFYCPYSYYAYGRLLLTIVFFYRKIHIKTTRQKGNSMITIEPGDLLQRAKWPFIHKGIATTNGSVFHNTPLQGEHTSSLEEFSNGKTVKVTKSSEKNRGEIIQRLQRSINTPQKYSYTKFNCEHSSSSILTGKASSPQLLISILVGGMICYKLLRD